MALPQLSSADLERVFEEYVFGFMRTDIEREVAMGRAGGGGNVLVAGGLLSYTEFLGQLVARSGVRPVGPQPKLANDTARFLEGFVRLGVPYRELLSARPEGLRGGLLHAYAIDHSLTVQMPGGLDEPCGLRLDSGSWTLIVEPYFRDLLDAAARLRDEIRATVP